MCLDLTYLQAPIANTLSRSSVSAGNDGTSNIASVSEESFGHYLIHKSWSFSHFGRIKSPDAFKIEFPLRITVENPGSHSRFHHPEFGSQAATTLRLVLNLDSFSAC